MGFHSANSESNISKVTNREIYFHRIFIAIKHDPTYSKAYNNLSDELSDNEHIFLPDGTKVTKKTYIC